MDYAEAVEKAPPGWRHFRIGDVERLPDTVRARELARIPPHEPDDHVLRAMFWTLIYHLEPEKWDELARAEPIHRDVLAALPKTKTALDVGAGSGRLTEHLVRTCGEVVAIEPAAGLRAILAQRLRSVRALDGWAEALPVDDGWSQLTAACGSFGPDTAILRELERVTASGGAIALISPEQPDWFQANGWRRITAAPIDPLPHPAWIDDFFGRLDPPHEMVVLDVG
ncbi:MAG TPA: methyltransferase domain-containing protein [Candidatus Dormibacteraeota bacterium]|nr:methyltransferase domain-containing protein [Candidatus Dormibacteraeota bacterium]